MKATPLGGKDRMGKMPHMRIAKGRVILKERG